MSRPVVLCDVDDVLGGYAMEVVRFANRYAGPDHPYTIEDVTSFDILGSLGCTHLGSRLVQHLIDTDYCLHMDILPGAQNFVRSLRRFADVVFCTSPHYSVPKWCHQRMQWLAANFAATKDEVILTSRKFQIRGDWLIDDKPEHVAAFQSWNGNALLFDRPWNRRVSFEALRVGGYGEVLEAIGAGKVAA